MSIIFDGPSNKSFGSFVNEKKPDIAIIYAEGGLWMQLDPHAPYNDIIFGIGHAH